jgi:hypothetical protein
MLRENQGYQKEHVQTLLEAYEQFNQPPITCGSLISISVVDQDSFSMLKRERNRFCRSRSHREQAQQS